MACIKEPPCLICGIRLYPRPAKHKIVGPSQWDPKAWRQLGIALLGPTWPKFMKRPTTLILPDDDVTWCFATASSRSRHVHLEPGGERVAIQETIYLQGDEIPEHERYRQRIYLGIHSACKEIANKVMRTERARIRSLGDLWMTLERRSQNSQYQPYRRVKAPFLPLIPCQIPGHRVFLELYNYYIPQSFIYHKNPKIPFFCPNSGPIKCDKWWDCDPLHIPKLTESILANLKPYKPTTPSRQLAHFDRLPQNIKKYIMVLTINHLIDTDGYIWGVSPFDCTYLVPQVYWKEAFLRIPFLWDIDRDAVNSMSGSDFDWEKLTRRIISTPETTMEPHLHEEYPKAWSYKDLRLSLPFGFTNRRRIWQILEEMFPNDVGMRHYMEREESP
ncbi:hypothetical protein NM208_g2262 [Fusarium decemcellulare]|uniref:Uncharacterized protein n=1 Tax=Fusarium decemcellulare TaxID=57161 RepID=A0ACC1ST86_9HYPO|nr:hypothetical protein NM208_g2262 [Fusarium decemcellulare]